MILCIGEAVIDMFQKNMPDQANGCSQNVFIPLPGGCSYNTSIAIGRLGVQAAFLGRISRNFFGDMQVQRLQENNVKVDLLLRGEQNPILAFIKTEEGKQPQYAFYEEGTVDRLFSTEELPSLPSDTTCIVFGSVSMNMEPIATTIETLIFREAHKTVIAFDPNIRPFLIKERDVYMKRFAKWAGICTIVKISSEDFEYIFPGTKPEECLRRMIDIGTRLTIVTLGSNGATALLKRDDGSTIKASAAGINIPKIADTVGAGDTFHGAFLTWLELHGKMSQNAIAGLSENDLHDALSFANRAAAFVCTRNGAEPPRLTELKDYDP
jgi:fructokinase